MPPSHRGRSDTLRLADVDEDGDEEVMPLRLYAADARHIHRPVVLSLQPQRSSPEVLLSVGGGCNAPVLSPDTDDIGRYVTPDASLRVLLARR